jgi:hypothetical protein
MSEMSLLIIFLFMGFAIICIGVCLANASIDEIEYRNNLYKQQRKENNELFNSKYHIR